LDLLRYKCWIVFEVSHDLKHIFYDFDSCVTRQLYALSGAAAGLSFDFPQEWLTPQSSPAQRTGHPKAAMGINHSV